MPKEKEVAFVAAIETAFAVSGMNLYEEFARLKALIDSRYRYIEAAQSRESMEAFVASMNIEDEALIGHMISIMTVFPKLADGFLNDMISVAAADLPSAQSGRKAKVSVSDMRAVISHIGALHTKGVQMGDAQERTSQKFGVGLRSVQRIWRERQALADSPFQTMDDVFQFFLNKH